MTTLNKQMHHLQ